MREFKTILCPSDFSDASHRALEYAEGLARSNDGTLVLVHVVHVSSGELYQQKDGRTLTFDEAKKLAASRLAEERDQFAHGYPKCEVEVEIGAPGEVILGMARRRNVDIIVMSSHGESSFDHVLVGGVTQEIVHHSPCPVLVVRRGAA